MAVLGVTFHSLQSAVTYRPGPLGVIGQHLSFLVCKTSSCLILAAPQMGGGEGTLMPPSQMRSRKLEEVM